MRVFLGVLLVGLFLFSFSAHAEPVNNTTAKSVSERLADMKRKADECTKKHYIIKDLELPAYTACTQRCMSSDGYAMRSMNGTPPSQEEVMRAIDGCEAGYKEVMNVVAKTQGVSPAVRLGLVDLTHQDMIDGFHMRCVKAYSNATQEKQALCDCATKSLVKAFNQHGYADLHRGYPRAVMACEG